MNTMDEDQDKIIKLKQINEYNIDNLGHSVFENRIKPTSQLNFVNHQGALTNKDKFSINDNKISDDLQNIEKYEESPQRYQILGVTSLISCIQSWNWALFSALPITSKQLFDFDDSNQSILLNIGSVIFILFSSINSIISEYSFRMSTILNALFIFSGTLIRMYGFYQTEHTLMTSQASAVLIGLAGCQSMSNGVIVSSRWFKSETRTFATGIASSANAVGPLFGSIVGPQLFKGIKQDQSDEDLSNCIDIMRNYNLSFCIVSLILLLIIIIYQPNRPQTPVSASAQVKRSDIISSQSSMLSNSNFIIIVSVFCITIGSNHSLSALFPEVIVKQGISELNSGQIGIISGLSVVVASQTLGPLNDAFHNHRNIIIKSISIISTIFLGSLQQQMKININEIDVQQTGIFQILQTQFLNGIHIISYELMSEIIYPVSENISNNFCNFWMNMIQIIIQILPNIIGAGVNQLQQILLMNIGATIIVQSQNHENKRKNVDSTNNIDYDTVLPEIQNQGHDSDKFELKEIEKNNQENLKV